MFEELMRDKIIVKTSDGKTYCDIFASVQHKKIITARTDIPIQPGDQVIRKTPAGIEEVFIVEDPGFTKGMAEIPDTYQMHVFRADLSQRSGTVIYNVTGANSRFNINSVDSSVNIINQDQADLFNALRQTIQKEVNNTDEQKKLLDCSNNLEKEIGKKDFTKKYAEFIAIAADHMSIIGPFIPALTQLLMGG